MSEEEKEETPPEQIKRGNNKGKKKPILFKDTVHNETVDVDSNEEWYTFGFLCELHQLGLIEDFVYQPESFPLTPKMMYKPFMLEPTKKKNTEKFLFHPHIYTADFKVSAFVDSSKALMYFSTVFKILEDSVRVRDDGRMIADIWMDVKGDWMRFGADSFSINQKLVYQAHGIYINKFIPRNAFQKMGAPHCAAVTPTGRASKCFGNMRFIENVYSSFPNLV